MGLPIKCDVNARRSGFRERSSSMSVTPLGVGDAARGGDAAAATGRWVSRFCATSTGTNDAYYAAALRHDFRIDNSIVLSILSLDTPLW